MVAVVPATPKGRDRESRKQIGFVYHALPIINSPISTLIWLLPRENQIQSASEAELFGSVMSRDTAQSTSKPFPTFCRVCRSTEYCVEQESAVLLSPKIRYQTIRCEFFCANVCAWGYIVEGDAARRYRLPWKWNSSAVDPRDSSQVYDIWRNSTQLVPWKTEPSIVRSGRIRWNHCKQFVQLTSPTSRSRCWTLRWLLLMLAYFLCNNPRSRLSSVTQSPFPMCFGQKWPWHEQFEKIKDSQVIQIR